MNKRQQHYALQNLERTNLITPPQRERDSLRPGQVVTISLVLEDPELGDSEDATVEIIRRSAGGYYLGRLRYALTHVDLDAGAQVVFGPEHVGHIETV